MLPLNLTPLREQIYNYLRAEMHQGRLLPGSTIDLNKISLRLGISKTPLRDALIVLESQGFVEILPRRGIRVATLSLEDVKNIYEICGFLESGILTSYFDQLRPEDIDRMEALNEEMREAVMEEDFDRYYNLNIEFHGVFVDKSSNTDMKRMLMIMKQRLYDFPRRLYVKEWELNNCAEHVEFLKCLREGDSKSAAAILRDRHWSFEVQEKSIRRFYSRVVAHLEAKRAEMESRASA